MATAAAIASCAKPLRSSLDQSCASVRRRCASMRSDVSLAEASVFGCCGGDDAAIAVGRSGGLQRFPNLDRNLFCDVGVLLEIRFRVLATLTDPLIAIGVPRAALTDDISLERDIDDRTHLRYAVPVRDVELRLAERRRDLVFDDLYARARADDFLPNFYLFELANVQADGSVEFQRPATRRRFRVAEHDADFFAQLVDKDHHAFAPRYRRGELAQCL